MEISTDPYEQKLYQMFKSYDIDAMGTLGQTALSKLCKSLELHDQGTALIDSLIISPSTRVSFKEFKEGLLNFLGSEMEESVVSEQEKTLVLNENGIMHGAPGSPGREISPKLVMGTKKYGRRSRPQSLVSNSSPSDSDTETITAVSNGSGKVQRSSSQSELQLSGRRRTIPGNKLKRCASLPAQKNRRFRDPLQKSPPSGNPITQNQVASSVESLETPQQLPACDILEMWETAGIVQPKKLMSSLGFDDEIVSINMLANALEEELRTCPNESDMLLKASLALHKAEIVALKQAFRQLMEENKQIRIDNRDVNKRAAILAQEIDERHAALENTTRSEIRMLEQRHAEVIRELTAQLVSDRENWSNLNGRLESRIKTLELEEVKYKLEMQTLQDENSALEKEQITLQKQITELLETNIKLNNEIVEIEERARCDDGTKNERETEEVLELIDKVTQLQTENANLRDKNDELAAEIEGLSVELNRQRSKKSPRGNSTDTASENDETEHSSMGVKRRGDSPSKVRTSEESPRLGKFRKCSNENSENEASGEWVALNSELGSNMSSTTIGGASSSGFSQDMSSVFDSKDEEIVENLKEKIRKLENELTELKKKGETRTATGKPEDGLTDEIDFKARCQELENSLEQMRKAYEDCEDYWQSKLTDERQVFDKERQIYEEEQQESDKKFAELMEKVREYEEQYSKDGRLSPIDERDNLEQQYADLEAEAEELRNNAKAMFEEKTKEIIKLQEKIVELQSRMSDGFEISEDQHIIKHEPSELSSPASSPICYLWNQSTIQAPARDYQNPNWGKPKKEDRLSNLTTSETSIFSTLDHASTIDANETRISPIQKPNTTSQRRNGGDADETASIASARSFETRSVASTHSVHKTSIGDLSTCSSPNGLKDELKRLKIVEIHLKDQIKDLSLKRDGLVMELQQLHEAKPVLEKAYARAAHPSLLQRINHLEQKNRHLQTVLRQQQQYTESIMHQTWQQQRGEIGELRNRLETQNLIMSEQVQRLANADMLVKDLYVENSHLAANIQRLEQQRSRANLLHQHHQGLSGVPGMP